MVSSSIDSESQAHIHNQQWSDTLFQNSSATDSSTLSLTNDSHTLLASQGLYHSSTHSLISQPTSNDTAPPNGRDYHPNFDSLSGPIFMPDYDPHEPFVPPRALTPLFMWESLDDLNDQHGLRTNNRTLCKIICLLSRRNFVVWFKGILSFACFFGIFFFFIFYNHFNNKLLCYYLYSDGY